MQSASNNLKWLCFSGLSDEYPVWSTRFQAFSQTKVLFETLTGDDIPPTHQDVCLMEHLMHNALLTTQLQRHTWRLSLTYKSVMTSFSVTSLWCWIPQAWCWSGMTVWTIRALAMDAKPRFCFSKGFKVMKLWQWSV